MDYNRRQRSLLEDERKRVEEREKAEEAEYQRKIEYLLQKPVISRIHPTRRALYQSQSAGPRLGTINH